MTDKILLAIDLLHESSWTRALPEAEQEAHYRGAKLAAVTVVPDITVGVDWRYAIRGAMGGSQDYDSKQVMQEASEQLKQLLEYNAEAAGTIDTYVRTGTVYEEILKTADEVEPGLIVMAARRPSLKEYLLGPNAARVVRHAGCSVLVVR